MIKIIYMGSDSIVKGTEGVLQVITGVAKNIIERDLGLVPDSLSQEDYESFVWETSVPIKAINPRKVAEEDIPTDRYFRNAWIDDGKKVFHDLKKCQDLKMEMIRVERNLKLKSLDSEFMKAMTQNDDKRKSEVAKIMQDLRDLPQNINLSKLSLEDLKAFTPDLLK